jgi:riboflavin biosynthesis pyrimidine reductase
MFDIDTCTTWEAVRQMVHMLRAEVHRLLMGVGA